MGIKNLITLLSFLFVLFSCEKEEFEPEIKVFPISAVSGKGLKELLFYVREMLDQFDDAPTVYEQEYNPED